MICLGSRMTEKEEAAERARTLFEAGAEIVYLAVENHERILVATEPPDRPGTMVAARSMSEVRRFLRDLKLHPKR